MSNMSALAWVKERAKVTVTNEELGGKAYQITRKYFRGEIPFHMKAQLLKECKNLENTETAYEKILFSNKTNLEYWHNEYLLVE